MNPTCELIPLRTYQPDALSVPEDLHETAGIYSRFVRKCEALSGFTEEAKEVLALTCSIIHSAMEETHRAGKASQAARHARDLISILMKFEGAKKKVHSVPLGTEDKQQLEWILKQRTG